MLSEQQCELARTLTGDKTESSVIMQQYATVSEANKLSAYQALDILLQEHNAPFDKGISYLQTDFANIAANYNISPSTLFCVYMEMKNR